MPTQPRANRRAWPLVLLLAIQVGACGASDRERRSGAPRDASAAPAESMESAKAPSPSRFVADFSSHEVGPPLNVFGARNGNHKASGGAKGLWLQILTAERAWDAVGVRTAKVQVDGDFDLQGSFREFGASGDASAKLLVVDATSPRGEAAYVERLRIDGKDLFKFGGEVQGSLENWGFVEASGNAGDLRLTRRAGLLHAYERAGANDGWIEFAPAQREPAGMPRVVKVGVKLSAASARSAEVTWRALSVEGNVLRQP